MRRALWFVFIVMLTACSSASGVSTSSQLSSNPQLTLDEADQVAQSFLEAWKNADYATMYSWISPNARDVYNEAAFAEQYEFTITQLTQTALRTQVTGSLRQGTTAVVQYDVVFETSMFGEINDPGRTMRLIETLEGWRVAWSRLDIFAELAEGARLDRRQTMPGRGNIYDRNGKVLVDQNGRSVVVYLVKQDMANVERCMQELARIQRREYDDIEAQFSMYNRETRFQLGEMDPETFQTEERVLLEVCDVGDDEFDTYIRSTRRYFGQLAPHIIGYVSPIQPEQVAYYTAKGYPADALVGQSGIEQAYEDELAGTPGGELLIVAPTGEVLRTVAESDPQPGQSVYLSIDRDLQEAVQQAMVEAYNYSSGTWASTSPGAAAVIMDVKTGEILAAVSYPWFDPNLFNPDSAISNRAEQITDLSNDYRTPLVDRVLMGSYPAGSIFKIVSTAAGLDSGVYTPDTYYTCTAVWSHPDDYLDQRKDWIYGSGAHDTINFSQALTYSCDTYYWELGVHLHTELGTDALTQYAYRLGLGVPTGQTDLPEDVGLIPNPEDHYLINAAEWSIGDTANLVIGQGDMQISPMQIARMTAAIANGGSLWRPQFVSKVGIIGETPSYQTEPIATSVLDFDPSIFETIQEAMCQVTLDPYGTARYMFDTWYDFQGSDVIVCGKTGTAQTGDETTPPQAWFTAFAPMNDPEIAISVIVENSCEGSEIAAPLTRRIIEDYYGMRHSAWPDLWVTGCVPLGE